MVWNIPLASLDQLSWLCFLPAPCVTSARSLSRLCEKLKSPSLCVSTVEQWLKHQCVTNIILLLKPKHGIILWKKINSIPTETRTPETDFCNCTRRNYKYYALFEMICQSEHWYHKHIWLQVKYVLYWMMASFCWLMGLRGKGMRNSWCHSFLQFWVLLLYSVYLASTYIPALHSLTAFILI